MLILKECILLCLSAGSIQAFCTSAGKDGSNASQDKVPHQNIPESAF